MSAATDQNSGRPGHWHPNRKRPSIYDNGVLDRLCAEISSNAQSIKAICEPDDMPRARDVFVAMGRDEAVRSRIAQAREAQQDVIVDELLTIADTASVEEVNLAKLRIWTRQWAAARFAPKKYGEKQSVEVQHTISETAAQVLRDLSDRARARQAIEAQCIDVTPTRAPNEDTALPAISSTCDTTAREAHQVEAGAAGPPPPGASSTPPLPESPRISRARPRKK